jgi:hypothetical protein
LGAARRKKLTGWLLHGGARRSRRALMRGAARWSSVRMVGRRGAHGRGKARGGDVRPRGQPEVAGGVEVFTVESGRRPLRVVSSAEQRRARSGGSRRGCARWPMLGAGRSSFGMEDGEQRCTRCDEEGMRLPVRWCWLVARLHYRRRGWQLPGARRAAASNDKAKQHDSTSRQAAVVACMQQGRAWRPMDGGTAARPGVAGVVTRRWRVRLSGG